MKKLLLKCIISMFLILLFTACGKENNEIEQAGKGLEESVTVENSIENPDVGQEVEKTKNEFPMILEDGKLLINSIFQSSIPNPDKGFEDGVDIASIEVTNNSELYLETAEIEIVLKNGQILCFEIYDLPKGKTIWAFDIENTTIETGYEVDNVDCQASFEETENKWEEEFQVSSELYTAKITNVTGQNQTDIKVRVHCAMDGVYFGGTSFEYDVENIEKDETILLEIIECYFGDAEVVKIIN